MSFSLTPSQVSYIMCAQREVLTHNIAPEAYVKTYHLAEQVMKAFSTFEHSYVHFRGLRGSSADNVPAAKAVSYYRAILTKACREYASSQEDV